MHETELPPRVRRVVVAGRMAGVTSRSLWWGERPDLTGSLTVLEWRALESFTFATDGS